MSLAIPEVDALKIEPLTSEVEFTTPVIETVSTQVENVEPENIHTAIPEISDKTTAYEAEKIASLLDKIQANLPNIPHTEEEEPVIAAMPEPLLVVTAPPKTEPQTPTPPTYTPPSEPKKAFPILMFLAGVAIILLLVSGVLWYYIYGPGTENTRFKEYYVNAQNKVKQCESNGRCLDAKGAVNQARDAAETPDEFKKVEELMNTVTKKEDEIKQKDRLLSPEPMDKGKVETGTTPKSPTPTPKAPANVPPSKDVKPADAKTTTTPTKTDTKPADSKATTPPKTDAKPATTAPKADAKPTDNKPAAAPKPPQGIKAGEPAPPTKPPKTPAGGQ